MTLSTLLDTYDMNTISRKELEKGIKKLLLGITIPNGVKDLTTGHECYCEGCANQIKLYIRQKLKEETK